MVRRCDFWRGTDSPKPFGFFRLQLMCDIFHRQSLYNIFCRRGKKRLNGNTAIFLVLLKAATQATIRSVSHLIPFLCHMLGKNKLLLSYALIAHTLPGLGDLGEDILTSNIAHAQHAEANRKVGSVAPKPVFGGGYHGREFIYSDPTGWMVMRRRQPSSHGGRKVSALRGMTVEFCQDSISMVTA